MADHRRSQQVPEGQGNKAINGPGGYFGWNLNALDDCLRGGFGARAPFTLVWSDSQVARQSLTRRWRDE